MNREDVDLVALRVAEETVLVAPVQDSPAGGQSCVDPGLRLVLRYDELEVDAVALLRPLVVRIQLLEEHDRVQPARIVDVGHLLPRIRLITEQCAPERAEYVGVDRIDAELDEAQWLRVRCE